MNQNDRRKSSGVRRKTAKQTRGWQTYLLMAICLFMLVAGFFFAARQHFSSMDYGMRNSKLRKQIDELEAEKRRLLLAREVSMSPAEIKKAAVKAQLTPPAEAAPASIELASATAPKAKAETKELSDTKTLVVKTSAVTAAAATKVAAVYRKPEVSEKAIRKAGLAE